jgi:hypothetical protein
MFVSGAYTCTFAFAGGSALSIGQTEDSFELEFSLNGDPIRGDNLGDSIQSFINRGGDCFLSTVLIDWDTALASRIFWHPSATLGTFDAGYIGSVASKQLSEGAASTGILVLTRVLTVTHSTPATLTANYAMLAPGFPIRTLFGPRLRRVPIRLQLLPFPTNVSVPTGANKFFTLT